MPHGNELICEMPNMITHSPRIAPVIRRYKANFHALLPVLIFRDTIIFFLIHRWAITLQMKLNKERKGEYPTLSSGTSCRIPQTLRIVYSFYHLELDLCTNSMKYCI